MRRPGDGMILAQGRRWRLFVLGGATWGVLNANHCAFPGRTPFRIELPPIPMPLRNTPATVPPTPSATPTPPASPTPTPIEPAAAR